MRRVTESLLVEQRALFVSIEQRGGNVATLRAIASGILELGVKTETMQAEISNKLFRVADELEQELDNG